MAFRFYGLEVVVDVTKPAKLDMEGLNVSERDKARIERNLKDVNLSAEEKWYASALRIREIGDYDVAFMNSREIWKEDPVFVVTIFGVGRKGELEEYLDVAIRAGKSAFPEPLKVLLEGRKSK